jgi:flagellar protein FlaI
MVTPSQSAAKVLTQLMVKHPSLLSPITLLSVSFVPSSSRIITIEDTREIYVPHRNKVHMVAYGKVTMNDLLINSLRMRPDRIVVGEVRGPEAITLFQAMDVGHRGTMGTLHANSARDAKERLIHSPMNVPEDMLPLVNHYVVMKMFPDGKRRVVSIVESVRTEGVAYGPIFSWRDGKLVMENTLGQNMEVLAERADTTVQELWNEFRRRKEFLDSLVQRELSFNDVFAAINQFLSPTKE